MKHKLLIVGQLPPPVHGSNIMMELFCNSLENIGYNISIIQKNFSKQQEDIGKLSISKLLKFPIITAKLIHHLITEEPDLCFYFISVQSPSYYADALFLLLIRLFGVKYVLYQHGKGLLDLEKKLGKRFGFIVHKTISHSIGALVLGEKLKMDMNKYILNDRLFVLPNATADIDIQKLQFKRNSQGIVKILFLSNLRQSKGPMEFLKMAKRIVEKRKDVRFILAGPKRSEVFYKKLQNFIVEGSLNEFIEMPGGMYGDEKKKLFLRSDIFVYPTLNDAFPLVNLEAMQCGLPIISSNVGSIPEMIRDGINGYIVETKNDAKLANRVLGLIEDPNLRTKMGRAGRRIYENTYTIKAYEKRLKKSLKYFYELKEKTFNQ